MTSSPTTSAPSRRLLLVHAHPDDETIGNGATMASYVADGVGVTLITCTLGEQGEVLVPELAHLAADRDDTLGPHRIGELARAMDRLGVTDHRFLGGAGHYRDSGMAWGENREVLPDPDARENAFALADLRQAADELVAVIREVRPQVLVTYDPWGGYGHPDHVQAHRVAMYGAQLARVGSWRPDLGPAWDISKIYWNAIDEDEFRDGIRRMREAGVDSPFGTDPDVPLPPFVIASEDVTTTLDLPDYAKVKMEALREHATQVTDDSPFFTMARVRGEEVWGREHYRLVEGRAVRPGGERESDLFAGIDTGE